MCHLPRCGSCIQPGLYVSSCPTSHPYPCPGRLSPHRLPSCGLALTDRSTDGPPVDPTPTPVPTVPTPPPAPTPGTLARSIAQSKQSHAACFRRSCGETSNLSVKSIVNHDADNSAILCLIRGIGGAAPSPGFRCVIGRKMHLPIPPSSVVRLGVCWQRVGRIEQIKSGQKR